MTRQCLSVIVDNSDVNRCLSFSVLHEYGPKSCRHHTSPEKWKTCLAYLVDIIVFSEDFESRKRHVAEIISLLKNAVLSLKLRKYKFFSRIVDYIGHFVRSGKLTVAEKILRNLKKATYPTRRTQMRGSIGICNAYRQFVPNFADISSPLTKHAPANGRKYLTPPRDEDLRSFESLKKALTCPTVLTFHIRPTTMHALPKEAQLCSRNLSMTVYDTG